MFGLIHIIVHIIDGYIHYNLVLISWNLFSRNLFEFFLTSGIEIFGHRYKQIFAKIPAVDLVITRLLSKWNQLQTRNYQVTSVKEGNRCGVNDTSSLRFKIFLADQRTSMTLKCHETRRAEFHCQTGIVHRSFYIAASNTVIVPTRSRVIILKKNFTVRSS